MSVKTLLRKISTETQRGEIATVLTLISVGLMLVGVVVGTTVIKNQSRIQSNAANLNKCPTGNWECDAEPGWEQCADAAEQQKWSGVSDAMQQWGQIITNAGHACTPYKSNQSTGSGSGNGTGDSGGGTPCQLGEWSCTIGEWKKCAKQDVRDPYIKLCGGPGNDNKAKQIWLYDTAKESKLNKPCDEGPGTNHEPGTCTPILPPATGTCPPDPNGICIDRESGTPPKGYKAADKQYSCSINTYICYIKDSGSSECKYDDYDKCTDSGCKPENCQNCGSGNNYKFKCDTSASTNKNQECLDYAKGNPQANCDYIVEGACIPGSTRYQCLTDKTCPYDDRVGVGYPLWCGPDKKSSYMMNADGECTWACQPPGKEKPKQDPRCLSDEENEKGKIPLDNGTIIKQKDGSTCKRMQCTPKDPKNGNSKTYWIRIGEACQNGAVYEVPGAFTDIECTLEKGYEIFADCNGTILNPPKPSKVEDKRKKPGTEDSGTNKSLTKIDKTACGLPVGNYFDKLNGNDKCISCLAKENTWLVTDFQEKKNLKKTLTEKNSAYGSCDAKQLALYWCSGGRNLPEGENLKEDNQSSKDCLNDYINNPRCKTDCSGVSENTSVTKITAKNIVSEGDTCKIEYPESVVVNEKFTAKVTTKDKRYCDAGAVKITFGTRSPVGGVTKTENGCPNGNTTWTFDNLTIDKEGTYKVSAEFNKGGKVDCKGNKSIEVTSATSSNKTSNKTEASGECVISVKSSYNAQKPTSEDEITLEIAVPDKYKDFTESKLVIPDSTSTIQSKVQTGTKNGKTWTYKITKLPASEYTFIFKNFKNDVLTECGRLENFVVKKSGTTNEPSTTAPKCLDESLTRLTLTKIEPDCTTCMVTNIKADNLVKYKDICSTDIQKINKYCTDSSAVSNHTLCNGFLTNECKTPCTTSPGSNMFLIGLSYDNASYNKIITAIANKQLNAIAASVYVMNATRVPGLQRQYCDPFQNQCDYGVTPEPQADASNSSNDSSSNLTNSPDSSIILSFTGCDASSCSVTLKGGETLIKKDGSTQKAKAGDSFSISKGADGKITVVNAPGKDIAGCSGGSCEVFKGTQFNPPRDGSKAGTVTNIGNISGDMTGWKMDISYPNKTVERSYSDDGKRRIEIVKNTDSDGKTTSGTMTEYNQTTGEKTTKFFDKDGAVTKTETVKIDAIGKFGADNTRKNDDGSVSTKKNLDNGSVQITTKSPDGTETTQIVPKDRDANSVGVISGSKTGDREYCNGGSCTSLKDPSTAEGGSGGPCVGCSVGKDGSLKTSDGNVFKAGEFVPPDSDGTKCSSSGPKVEGC